MAKLSVFMIVKNESQDLPRTLTAAQKVADEMVVVDSGSVDGTREVASAYAANVFSRPFDNFSAQKTYALEHTSGDWALSLDADEVIPEALAHEIRAKIESPGGEAGFTLKRRIFFLGREMRHGGLGNEKVVRLFKKGAGRYSGARIHECILVDGPVGTLKHALLHYTNPTIRDYVRKSDFYTTLAAEEMFQGGRRFHLTDHLRPFWEFFQRYVLKLGFLDGYEGFLWAALSSHSAWIRQIKLRELQTKGKR